MKTLKMQYKITGEGQTLVLVPGGLTGWASWDPFIHEFSSSKKVVQVQLLNVQFGLEKKYLPPEYSVKTESGALFESLKEAGVSTPTDVIAWSYGAFVALDFALDYPQLIKSLVLIEPPAFWVLKGHNQLDNETLSTMDYFKTISGDISEQQLEGFMNAASLAPPGTSLKDHPQWENWNKHRQSLMMSESLMNYEDNPVRLKNFHRPVLLIKGTGSAPYYHKIIGLLKEDLPNAQVVELAGSHAAHIVSRDQFMGIIKNFHSRN